ncbi:MAG: hypothetical protein AAGJ18_08665 [Bacteroidota bacterium]
MNIITIKDETALGTVLNEKKLDFATESVTIADIIKARVATEVAAYNKKLPSVFTGLIQPSAAEKVRNGFKVKKRKLIDAEKQIYIALDAFQKNGFFVLVDDWQADSLEQRVEIRSDTTVSFIKLTPLVGG